MFGGVNRGVGWGIFPFNPVLGATLVTLDTFSSAERSMSSPSRFMYSMVQFKIILITNKYLLYLYIDFLFILFLFTSSFVFKFKIYTKNMISNIA